MSASPNPWKQLQSLLAPPALQVGRVVSITAGVATVRLPGGGELRARGEATTGATVFVRGQVIEGPAPDLAVIRVEI